MYDRGCKGGQFAFDENRVLFSECASMIVQTTGKNARNASAEPYDAS